MNINFKVIGLTRLGIKHESAAPKADAFRTRPYMTSKADQNLPKVLKGNLLSTRSTKIDPSSPTDTMSGNSMVRSVEPPN